MNAIVKFHDAILDMKEYWRNNRGILCRLLGHDTRRAQTIGLNPRTMKIVERHVVYCDRCDFREQIDENIADYDSKKGYNLCWGSAGMCYGCEHKDSCESVTWKATSLQGVWLKCPINNFKIDSAAEPMLWNWKDSLIDYAQSV